MPRFLTLLLLGAALCLPAAARETSKNALFGAIAYHAESGSVGYAADRSNSRDARIEALAVQADGRVLVGDLLPDRPRPDGQHPRAQRFERAARGEPERQRGGGGGGDFVRFFVNWGERRGATPARLLAHLCRRTGVEGREVGAIRVQPGSSSFEVAARLAPEFERRAREPDPEEPSIRITRFAPR